MFSNTVSTTVFDTRKVIDLAVKRCKLKPEQITPEIIATANDELYLMLSALGNMNIPLWAIEKHIYGIVEGNPNLVTNTGTVDVLEATLRYLQQVTGTNTDTVQSRTIAFDTPTTVTTVGVRWGGPSKPLTLARSDDNFAYTFLDIYPAVSPATVGEWTWYDIADPIPALFFLVQTVDLSPFVFLEIYTGNMPSEIPLARLNRDDYTNLPNKFFPSQRPLQYWFDRQVRQPVMRLWPAPNASAIHQQIVVWAKRQIMDVGSMTQELEVPQRWYDAIVAGLAARIAQAETDVNPDLIAPLQATAAMTLTIAQGEERDNSPMRMAPRIGCYTA